MFSPNFATIWPTQSRPAAYNDSADKIAILMTDGEYNTKNGRSWNANQVSTIAVDTCNAMKAQGIRVYTVGFALGGNSDGDRHACSLRHWPGRLHPGCHARGTARPPSAISPATSPAFA